MVEHKISFDLTCPDDYNEVFMWLLEQPAMEKYKDIVNKSSNSMVRTINQPNSNEDNSKIVDLNKEINESKSQIKEHEGFYSRNNETITAKEDEIKNLKDELAKQKGAYTELDTLKSKHASEIESKDIEIQKLKRHLANYDVAYASDDPTAKTYFKVQEDGSLEMTRAKAYSLFFACKKGESYIYSINEEGPINQALEDVNKYILPFCDIKENMNGANRIKVEELGSAKIPASQIIIIEKAKVSLIKQ